MRVHGYTYLAKLANRVTLVVRTDELEVFHGGHRHAPMEVEAVVAVGKRGLPCLEGKHVAVATLLDAR